MGMSSTPTKAVIYCRVSTNEQGIDGLGIDAQRESCRAFAQAEGLTIVREFVEVGSGGDDDRPELAQAVRLAQRSRAVLIVAKLDRLSRSVALVASMLQRSGVALRVAECGNAGILELQIRSVIAEEERRKIGERTRDALQAAKRRGTKLGSARPGHWEGREDRRLAGARKGSEVAARKRLENKAETVAEALPIVESMRSSGASMRAIARALTAHEILTPGGCDHWNPSQVSRLIRQR